MSRSGIGSGSSFAEDYKNRVPSRTIQLWHDEDLFPAQWPKARSKEQTFTFIQRQWYSLYMYEISVYGTLNFIPSINQLINQSIII